MADGAGMGLMIQNDWYCSAITEIKFEFPGHVAILFNRLLKIIRLAVSTVRVGVKPYISFLHHNSSVKVGFKLANSLRLIVSTTIW